ncbi:hypothetical protein DFH07DRAFT_756035 [Mycena maculata]|uniref:Transcription factor TFIIIC triple barrel domain-containing protein n=1 Tax=Mycena maculata TaxID=230809 RepID=A0AAD7HYC4_9AGAR|nr:hypothetical protein DFH07DRAFT_756035 [Mycena maculata]
MSEFSSVCPGYKQVDAFGPDEEYEEEEVTYVTLDLGNVEPTLIPSSSNYRLIGLDTPTPFLQLSGTIFKGRHDSLLGTELIFTDGKDGNKRSITHVANTEQRVCFKEVQLRAKKVVVPAEPENEEDGRLKVDRMTGKTPAVPRASRTKKVAPVEGVQVGADSEAVEQQMQTVF